MKIRHFKELLDILSIDHTITLTLKLWEHHGPPRRYDVRYPHVRDEFTEHMFHNWKSTGYLSFKDVNGYLMMLDNRRIRILLVEKIHIEGDRVNIDARNFKDALQQLSTTNTVTLALTVQKTNPRPANATKGVPDTFIHLESRLKDVQNQFDGDMLEKTHVPLFYCTRTNGTAFKLPRHRIRALTLKHIEIQPKTKNGETSQ